MPATDPYLRMASRKVQKRIGTQLLTARVLPLLVLLVSLPCCLGAAAVHLQTHTTSGASTVVGLASGAADVALSDGQQNPSGPMAATEGSKEGSGLSNMATDGENLSRLFSAIVAADVTETEKPTDSRFFLGVVSQKIKRHLFVDVLALTALLLGYYLFVAGLEQKAAEKSAGSFDKS